MPESVVMSEQDSGTAAHSPADHTRDGFPDFVDQSKPEAVPLTNHTSRPARDSSWLEMELCRDFQRSTCSKGPSCRFAHAGSSVVTKEGMVTCCYDFLKVCL